MKARIPNSLRAAIVEVRSVARDSRLALYSLFILLSPFYVVSSGLPQPADWLLLILAPMMLRSWNGRLPIDVSRTLRSLMLFCGYAIAINLFWSFAMLSFTTRFKEGFLLSPTFYIYDSLLFLTFLLMYQRYGERFLWLTSRLVMCSLGLQLVVSAVFARSGGLRAKLFFNSPNQLGYYALLSACLLLVGQRRLRISTLKTTLALTACSYLALMSASKAALASVGLLGIAIMVGKVRTMVLTSLVLIALIFTSNPFSAAIERAAQRIENDQSHDFLEERGYDRIINNPEYWIFGSGEGGYERFKATTVIGTHELHSSLGTLFFCYGIVGTILFAAFMLRILRRSPWRIWLIMAPALAYGMTHQGLRFTLFWVFLAMVVALRNAERATPITKEAPA